MSLHLLCLDEIIVLYMQIWYARGKKYEYIKCLSK